MPEERWELKKIIKEKFRTQENFAYEIGVVDSYVSKVVRGFKTPEWDNRGKVIAKILGITKKKYIELMSNS